MPRVKPRCLVKIPWRVGHESDRFSYVLSLSFFYQEHLTNATEGTTTAEPTPQILQMISMMGSDRRKDSTILAGIYRPACLCKHNQNPDTRPTYSFGWPWAAEI